MKSDKTNFSKEVERLIDPITIGSLHFMQYFNQLLPKPIQKIILKTSSKKTPNMGFVVEPYSSFLCYEIADTKFAKSLLPDGFDLVKTSIFDNDEPHYYCIFGCVRAHTSAFWGVRNEFYVIAEDKKTGLLSWMIIDYDTNTISYDNKNGLCGPNSSRSVITINHRGRLFVDIQNNKNNHKLVFDANIENGIMTNLNQRLWLEGNLSIGYGRNLSEKDGDIFSLKFEPCEVEKALSIPLDSLNLEINTWYPILLKSTPTQVVCFPYAQHFISDSPGYFSNIKNKDELLKANSAIDFSKIKVFSTKSFKIMFLLGTMLSFTITVILIILLINK
ncbi:MAG: hypothetical protein WA087_04340 [Candidatus Saccharimonadales bacterium]